MKLLFDNIRLFIKIISCSIVFCVLFALTLYISCRFTFGDIDFALLIQHISLIESYSLFPFWKEIILGIILFSFLLYIACQYLKTATFMCLSIIVYSFFDGIFLFYNQKDTSLFKREYITLPVRANKTTKNIIVISLESIDDLLTFDDVTNAGNLIPKLTSLKKEGTTFDGYYEMTSMRPTIPSFYAKNCGIAPRPTTIWSLFKKSSKRGYGAFPHAVCVSDILKENKYNVYYIMGGNLTDEGAKNFFDTHSIDKAVGRIELKKLGYSQKEASYFIPDSELYKYAKNILSNSKNVPFALYVVTGNTHGPKNDNYRVEPECETKYNDPRDAFLCLDKITYDFVKWCQQQSWYKNTVIYLIGDHLAVKNFDIPALSKKNSKNHPRRQVYTLMLNESSNKLIKKEFTQVDFAPTFLESIGFISPKFGLGYSLFRDKPTLVERLGPKNFSKELEKSADDFHKIVSGIILNGDK